MCNLVVGNLWLLRNSQHALLAAIVSTIDYMIPVSINELIYFLTIFSCRQIYLLSTPCYYANVMDAFMSAVFGYMLVFIDCGNDCVILLTFYTLSLYPLCELYWFVLYSD